MCGGLRIRTSRPYALCHQLSKGADEIIISVPQMQMNAPSGPRKPQNRTERARCPSVPLNVVWSTTQPQVSPEMMAASCSRTCGGDQNVSRPIVRCHEMSQIRPVTMNSDAMMTAYSGQVGSFSASVVTMD